MKIENACVKFSKYQSSILDKWMIIFFIKDKYPWDRNRWTNVRYTDPHISGCSISYMHWLLTRKHGKDTEYCNIKSAKQTLFILIASITVHNWCAEAISRKILLYLVSYISTNNNSEFWVSTDNLNLLSHSNLCE